MGKFLIGLATTVLSGFFSTPAAAQGITVTISSVTRGAPDGYPPSNRVVAINRADCLADERLSVTLGFLGPGLQSYALELWVGNGCDQRSARQSVLPTCWQVYSGLPTNIVTNVEVGVRDLLSGLTTGHLAGEGGASSQDAACEPTSSAVGPQSLTLYALLTDPNQDVFGDATWKTTYKLIPPQPPDIVSVASGDRKLSVDLMYTSFADTAVDGVQLFCDPAPNEPNADANGRTTTDDAGAPIPSCPPSAELVPGADAASLQHLRCGSATKTALTAVAGDLTNGVSYNVAAASVDTYGNVGPLSSVACQAPQARTANSKVQACAFAGPRSGASACWLTCLIAISAALSRRHLGRRRWGATVD